MKDPSTIVVLCNVHAGGEWSGKTRALRKGIEKSYRTYAVPDIKLRAIWVRIPKGQAYLAGSPSSASTLLVPVPDGISQENRVAMMSAICQHWQETTGCSVNEIVVNAMSMSEAKRYLQLSQSHFDPKKMTVTKLKLALRLLLSGLRLGYLTTTINLTK